MSRIYESSALQRDDENPFHPNERDATVEPEAMRSVPGTVLSKHLVPHSLRHLAISLDVSTPDTTYESGVPIQVCITMTNAMPFPITLSTKSARLWTWYVDGHIEAEYVEPETAPTKGAEFGFSRGETKRFWRCWNQLFRVSSHEWEPAPSGTHTIGASINVDGSGQGGLRDETDVRIIDT